jgi:hypothetical protein
LRITSSKAFPLSSTPSFFADFVGPLAIFDAKRLAVVVAEVKLGEVTMQVV